MEKTNPFKRASLLYGKEGLDALKNACVIVAGCGGVGSFAIESLARSGVGRLVLIDKDVVEETNINRQLCALQSTIGQYKTDVWKARIAQINPGCEVVLFTGWYDENMDELLLEQNPDYVLDCIDSIGSKKDLIRFCLREKIPLISSMGMARRLDPSKVELVELEKTAGDPMAKILRLWKRKSRIRGKIMTVCSKEIPMPMPQGEPLPSSIFVPSTAGILMASRCVSDLQKKALPKAEKEPAASMGE